MSNSVNIDGNKLLAAIKATGMTPGQVSRGIGASDSYITTAARYRRMGGAYIVALEEKYGVKRELFIEEKDNQREETTAGAVDWDKLYQCIYAAVYEAVKKAWSE